MTQRKLVVLIATTGARPLEWLTQAMESCAPWPVEVLMDEECMGKAYVCARWWFKNEGNLPEYIALLDDDDYLLPRALDVFVAEMDAHPDRGWARAQLKAIGAKGEPLNVRAQQPPLTIERMEELREGRRFGTRGFQVVRTAMLKECGGFNPLIQGGEDLELDWRLCRNGFNGLWISSPRWVWRKHEANSNGIRTGELAKTVWKAAEAWKALPARIPTAVLRERVRELQGVFEGEE